MPMINFTDPITILLGVVLFLLITILSKELKKSIIPAIMLFVFLAILIGHAIGFVMTDPTNQETVQILAKSIGIDFVFVFLSFISYLWVDDMQTKLGKKKSIDNSLDWFWSKV